MCVNIAFQQLSRKPLRSHVARLLACLCTNQFSYVWRITFRLPRKKQFELSALTFSRTVLTNEQYLSTRVKQCTKLETPKFGASVGVVFVKSCSERAFPSQVQMKNSPLFEPKFERRLWGWSNLHLHKPITRNFTFLLVEQFVDWDLKISRGSFSRSRFYCVLPIYTARAS